MLYSIYIDFNNGLYNNNNNDNGCHRIVYRLAYHTFRNFCK